MHCRIAILSSLLVVIGAGPAAAQRPSALAAIVPSVADAGRADLDTTVAPCHDFFQYATGSWYRDWYQRMPPSKREESPTHGPEQARAGVVLRQLVARAPALAKTTNDPTLRAVGYFYGSCLTDQSGTAEGAVGDTARTSYCFRAVRQHLDRALFELLMEYVWPPAARAEVTRFWPNMQVAAIELFKRSTVLPDSTKQWSAALAGEIRLYASEAGRRDSTTEWWRARMPAPAGRRPSDVPFAGAIGATWVYRDYAGLKFTPTDFKGNLAYLVTVPDTLPPPALPATENRQPTSQALLDVLLGDRTWSAGVGNKEAAAPLSMLIPPVINGVIDIGGWYGMIGPVMGHEMSHGTLRGGGSSQPAPLRLSASVQNAFGAELFHGQLEHFSHPFDDSFGVLVAYGAFRRALEGQSWPSIEGFTPEQRFFLGVARGWRGGLATIDPINNGQARWRVLTNGTLSAMPAFAKAFSCQAGDPMAGGHVWYRAPWKGIVLTAEHRKDFAKDSAIAKAMGWTPRGLEKP